MGFASLYELLRSTYDEMMPLYVQMAGIVKGIAGSGVLFYIALWVWAPIACVETVDVFSLLRSFVLGFCIMFFPTVVLGTVNAISSPAVQGTEMIIHQQKRNLTEPTTKRDRLQEETYLRNPETAYLISSEKFDQKIEEMGIIRPEDAMTITGMCVERVTYQTKQQVMKLVHDFLESLFHALGLIIDIPRTSILIVLSILEPIMFGIAVWDGLADSPTAWFSRYTSVYLWLSVSSILTTLLTKIRMLMMQKGTDVPSDPDCLLDSGMWYYIVFFLIGIVGYFCVPTVAGWIIEAGGGISSYGRNVNQTAQRGAQDTYIGGKATMAGVGAAVGNVGGRIKGALLKGKQKSSDHA